MTGQVSFGRAVAVTVAGLLLVVAAMPFPVVRLHGELRELSEAFGAPADGFTRDDVWTGLFVGGVALVVVLAGVLRRPMVIGWAALPAAVAVGVMLVVLGDVQFGTSVLASDVQTAMNRDRSVAPAGWVTLVGMVVALVGLAVPPVGRWRRRR